MDAVGSSRAAFYGLSEGAAMSILFAATYPERTAALVVRSAYPRRMWAPDYPWGQTEEAYERDVERALQVFGPREQGRESVEQLGQFTDPRRTRSSRCSASARAPAGSSRSTG